MKCPLCQQDAKNSFAYPNSYVCGCTGKLEDISVLKNLKEAKSRLPDIDLDKAVISRHPQNIIISAQAISRMYRVPMPISATQAQMNFGSRYLNHLLGTSPNGGDIISVLDGANQSEGGYYFFYNLAKSINKTLIIDSTQKMEKFCERLSNKRFNIYKPTSLDDAYHQIIKEINNYDAIAFLDADTLSTKDDISSGTPSRFNKNAIHDMYLSHLNSIKENSSAAIFIGSRGIDSPSPFYTESLCPQLASLKKFHAINIKVWHKDSRQEKVLKIKNEYNIYKAASKQDRSTELPLLTDGTYNEIELLKQLCVELDILSGPRRVTYNGADVTLKNGHVIKNGDDLVRHRRGLDILLTSNDEYKKFLTDEIKKKSPFF